MANLMTLLHEIEQEARRAPMDLDLAAYRRAGRRPTMPILVAGETDAPLCLFARELGQEEVLRGQPLIGAAGRRVRRALFERLFPDSTPDPPYYTRAMSRVLLTNTVPYKPVGNKEYDRDTKSRFRPFVELLLVSIWSGSHLLPMGEGAFKWFAPYADKGEVVAFWENRDRRFTDTMAVTVTANDQGERVEKRITLAPIPHPSPRSPFMLEFPDLLENRLSAFLPQG